MKLLTTLLMLVTPFSAYADSIYPVAVAPWPIHMLSQSGHIVGGFIVIGALMSFYRQKGS